MKLQRRSATKREKIMLSDRKYRLVALFLLATAVCSAIPAVKQTMGASPYNSLLYWGSALSIFLIFCPRIHIFGQLRNQEAVNGYAIRGAVFYILICFFAGVIAQTLKGSPYDHSIPGIFYNVITIFPAIMVREIARAYAFGTAWRTAKHRIAVVGAVTLLMAVTDINLGKIAQLQSYKEIFIYLVRDVLPTFTESALLSMLVFYGGAKSGILYLGIIELFYKTFPFIPELMWLIDGTIGITYPVLYLMWLAEQLPQLKEGVGMQGSKKLDLGFLAALFASVLFAWFCVGVFRIYPSTILTGSMEPMIQPGDVVLIRKLVDEQEIYELAEGDIINFKRQDFTVTHRIEEIITDEAGNRTFRTKGDNNKSADTELLKPQDIKGTIIRVIPKVGLPILLMHSQSDIPEGVVDQEGEVIVNESSK